MPDRTPARPWQGFRAHFESNALRPFPALEPEAGNRTRPPDNQHTIRRGKARRAVAAVLARFQLGEAGEGRIAHEIDRVSVPGVDDDYRAALKLFVKEEGRHARILAGIVKACGGTLLRAKASNHLFRSARRLLGVRFKVLVLLIAEVVGGVVYEALERTALVKGASRALREIANDERAHLRFHAAFVGQQPPLWRALLRPAFWSVGLCAVLVVLFENLADFRRMELSPLALARDLLRELRRADRVAFAPAPVRTPDFASVPLGEPS
ncbi:MAG TPA: hypothetical protein VGG33_05635 [Polyangia bacterium]